MESIGELTKDLARMMYQQKRGFTLIELSIVLVVIGLLVGGVLAGQNLIRASQLRSVITEFQTFQSGTVTFSEKYSALPGDMRNATEYWGVMTNCGGASPSSTGTQTCDGDSDGIVDAASAASRTGEMYGFWQQLANEGYIEGAFSGVAGSGSTTHAVLGENVPASKLSGTGWAVSTTTQSGSSIYVNGAYVNAFFFGGQHSSAPPIAVGIKPEEAWSIDKKVDDGAPAAGKVKAVRLTNCITPADPADPDAEYDLSYTSIACGLAFIDVM